MTPSLLTDYQPLILPDLFPITARAYCAALKLLTLCNYPGPDATEMAEAEWNSNHADYRQTYLVPSTQTHVGHRVRFLMTPAYTCVRVFLTDAPRVDPPQLA